jgi:hypothetical protein
VGETDEEEIWRAEERLWLEGAGAYRLLLDPACLMAFGGFGVLRGAAAVTASLEGAPRWSAVTMTERAQARPAPDLAVLAYLAEGGRGSNPPHRALCTSTWRRAAGGDWRLVQHMQAAVA